MSGIVRASFPDLEDFGDLFFLFRLCVCLCDRASEGTAECFGPLPKIGTRLLRLGEVRSGSDLCAAGDPGDLLIRWQEFADLFILLEFEKRLKTSVCNRILNALFL